MIQISWELLFTIVILAMLVGMLGISLLAVLITGR
jgi:hypothetical protein